MRNTMCALGLISALLLVGGCGSGTSATTAFGTIAVTSISGTLGCSGGSPVTITGSDYSEIIGTSCTVRFTATTGTPFLGGGSDTVDVIGVITSDTTVTCFSPAAVICGVPSFTAFVTVILPSGVAGTSTTPIATFSAPTLTSILPSTFPAALPTAYVLTGTGFGPLGGTVQVTWTAPTPMFNGSTAIITSGTVASMTTIIGLSPEATVCGVASLPAAVTHVQFPGGCCTPPGTNIPVTFTAPTITAVTNTGVAPYGGTSLPASFGASVPEPYLITGTGFGPVGSAAVIRFRSLALTPYNSGTSATINLLGVITSPTTVTGLLSPEAAICGPLNDLQNVMVTVPNGSCTLEAVGAVDLIAPTVTGLDNVDRGIGTTLGGSLPFGGFFYGHLPEKFVLTGTDFGPVGSIALVTMTYAPFTNNTTPLTPYAGETSATIVVPVFVTSRTSMLGTMPAVRLTLDATLETPDPATIPGHNRALGGNTYLATMSSGSCNAVPYDPGTEFSAPVLSPGLPDPAPFDTPSTLVLGAGAAPDFTLTGVGFGPLGPCTVTFEDTVAPNTAFNGARTTTVNATILNETTITGTFPTITAPRLTADALARVIVIMPDGSNAYCSADVNFVAPPTITTITNSDAATAAPSFLTPIATTDYLGCIHSTMTIVGTGFEIGPAPTPTTTTIYDLDSGLGPLPGLVPVRRLGTDDPTGDDLGDATVYTAALTATTIAARIRTDAALDDLDVDRDGLVTARVRVVNADGQFHETGAAAPLDPVYRTTTPALNLGASMFVRDNTSVAIDPSSFTDDFGIPTGANDLVTPGFNLVAVCGADDPGGLPGVFAATDAWVSRSLDGGTTWTSALAGLGAVEVGLPPASPFLTRNYFHAEYDQFGTLWMCYLRSDPDFLVGQDDIVLVGSLDNGATWTQVSVLASTAPFAPFGAGLLSAPHMAIGANGAAGDRLGITWVDRTGSLGFGFSDVVRVTQVDPVGFGAFIVPPALGPANDVSDAAVAPPAFFLLDPKVAIGPSGEVYVTWQEPNAFFTGVTFRTDRDQDGIAAPAFVFNVGVDTAIATTPLLFGFPPLPSAPDTSGLLPHTDLAVAQAGNNSGRICFAYTHVVPAGAPGTRDFVEILTRISDDDTASWSSPVSPALIDTADRLLPSITSDRATGRFHVAWYDTQTNPAGGPFTAFRRHASASADGVTWGADRNLYDPTPPSPGARAAATHTPNFDNDFGLFADIVAVDGCVFAGWSDPGDSGTNDPIVVVYQQNGN